MKYVDPDGKMYGIFVGQNGKVVGNDGIDDSRVYALKTTESKFANDVAGAGLSREALDATVKFIKKNSGNASEFRSNSIAYDNSIEIEGSATVRRAMIDIIEQDNSRGGTSDQNNREYGGSVNGGIVEAAPPGPVSNPKKNGLATITLSTQQNTSAKFHSHPSGTRNEITRSGIGTTINTFFFTQSPSPDDIINAGSITNYVFGRADGMVYIYNAQGVQAVINYKNFINFDK